VVGFALLVIVVVVVPGSLLDGGAWLVVG